MYKSYYKAQEILSDWNTYEKLCCFVNNKNGKFKFDLSVYFDQMCNEKTLTKVPIVISEPYLKSFSQEVFPAASFYQLRFIFNELDSNYF